MSRLSNDSFLTLLLEFFHTQSAMIGLPGAGIAVIRGGEILHTGGTGVLEAGSNRQVDADSLFAVASCSKAFTTTLCAQLAEQGKLSWDQPVRDYWPEFSFGSETLSAQVTLRDFCANRTGISQAAAVEYGSNLSFDEVVNGAGGLPTIAAFRDRYTYSNLQFTITAAVCGMRNNKSFAESLAEGIFSPLGMKDASTDRPDIETDLRFARPHVRDADKMRPIKLVNLSNLIGAGSVSLSPNDAAQWLRFNLGYHPAGGAVLSAEGRAELTRIQTRTRSEDGFFGYGLGWRIGTNNNISLVDHTGSIGGVISIMRLVPQSGLGLFLSCNAGGPEITDLRNAVVDLAVELDRCEDEEGVVLYEKAAQALALKQTKYRKSVWQDVKYAVAGALATGEFDGGPMGPMRIVEDSQGLIISLDLLPEYHYRIMSADADGHFPLRSIRAPEHWWGENDTIPHLSVSESGNVLAWKNMWYGDCSYRRA